MMSLLSRVVLVAGALFASRASAGTPELSPAAERLFAEKKLSGALLSQDVRSGRTVASVSREKEQLGLPLSTIKLLLVAIYLEHERQLGKNAKPDIDLIIAQGKDDPGRVLALRLRRALGSSAILNDLNRYGFPACSKLRRADCTSLEIGTSDAEWANALSLGERHFRTTLAGLSSFLRMAGNDGRAGQRQVLSVPTARRLQQAMRSTIEGGTARAYRSSLKGSGAIGGKTGTTAVNGSPYDGIFAGLVFDVSGRPRYTVVTVVRRGGSGGGAAAGISVELARMLLRRK